MSISDKMNTEEYQEQIAAESQRVQEAVSKCDSGKTLLEASQLMASSEEMTTLMQIIDSEGVSEEDKFLMGKYMGQLLQQDPDNGLQNYSDYLVGIANDPTYEDRKDYFMSISQAALTLNGAQVYRDYVSKYQLFEQDQSEEAKTARQVMEDMSNKMRQLIEDDEQTTH